jgi:hypothetical protein
MDSVLGDLETLSKSPNLCKLQGVSCQLRLNKGT